MEFTCVEWNTDKAKFSRDRDDIEIEISGLAEALIFLSREDALKLAAWIQEQFDGGI